MLSRQQGSVGMSMLYCNLNVSNRTGRSVSGGRGWGEQQLHVYYVILDWLNISTISVWHVVPLYWKTSEEEKHLRFLDSQRNFSSCHFMDARWKYQFLHNFSVLCQL